MPALDLWDLVELYARRGVDDWSSADANVRRRAGDCFLATQIATKYQDVNDTINAVFNGAITAGDAASIAHIKKLSFIPMPKPGKHPIERCFFLPIREIINGKEKISFDLALLVTGRSCLAFRFEPADKPTWRHGYGHIQMNQTMLKKTISLGTAPGVGVPPWIPQSYPAFPVSTSDPLRMFFAMGTAIHGYANRGFADLLIDIFQKSGRTPVSTAYLAELRLFLGGTIRHRVDPGWKGFRVLMGEFRQWGTRTISKKRR
jgi:hypothetical protein